MAIADCSPPSQLSLRNRNQTRRAELPPSGGRSGAAAVAPGDSTGVKGRLDPFCLCPSVLFGSFQPQRPCVPAALVTAEPLLYPSPPAPSTAAAAPRGLAWQAHLLSLPAILQRS